MSRRFYKAEQFAYALVLAVCGLAVAVGLVAKAINDLVTIERVTA